VTKISLWLEGTRIRRPTFFNFFQEVQQVRFLPLIVHPYFVMYVRHPK